MYEKSKKPFGERNLRMMLAIDVVALLSFAPSCGHKRPSIAHGYERPSIAHLRMSALDVIASPLRKFEPTNAAAGGGSITDGLPLEVVALFSAIVLVGVAGLIKQSGGLSGLAPTVGLGEQREDLAEAAQEARKQEPTAPDAEMTQAEKEKQYFKIIAEEQAAKRGGSKERKPRKKKQKR